MGRTQCRKTRQPRRPRQNYAAGGQVQWPGMDNSAERARATKESGFQNYDNLSASQRERVDSRMQPQQQPDAGQLRAMIGQAIQPGQPPAPTGQATDWQPAGPSQGTDWQPSPSNVAVTPPGMASSPGLPTGQASSPALPSSPSLIPSAGIDFGANPNWGTGASGVGDISLGSLSSEPIGQPPMSGPNYQAGGSVADYRPGGTVAGGPPGVDTVPANLNNGEYVLPPETSQAMGGKQALDQAVMSTTGVPPVGAGVGGQQAGAQPAPQPPTKFEALVQAMTGKPLAAPTPDPAAAQGYAAGGLAIRGLWDPEKEGPYATDPPPALPGQAPVVQATQGGSVNQSPLSSRAQDIRARMADAQPLPPLPRAGTMAEQRKERTEARRIPSPIPMTERPIPKTMAETRRENVAARRQAKAAEAEAARKRLEGDPRETWKAKPPEKSPESPEKKPKPPESNPEWDAIAASVNAMDPADDTTPGLPTGYTRTRTPGREGAAYYGPEGSMVYEGRGDQPAPGNNRMPLPPGAQEIARGGTGRNSLFDRETMDAANANMRAGGGGGSFSVVGGAPHGVSDEDYAKMSPGEQSAAKVAAMEKATQSIRDLRNARRFAEGSKPVGGWDAYGAEQSQRATQAQAETAQAQARQAFNQDLFKEAYGGKVDVAKGIAIQDAKNKGEQVQDLNADIAQLIPAREGVQGKDASRQVFARNLIDGASRKYGIPARALVPMAAMATEGMLSHAEILEIPEIAAIQDPANQQRAVEMKMQDQYGLAMDTLRRLLAASQAAGPPAPPAR